jgi:hypothetical protein
MMNPILLHFNPVLNFTFSSFKAITYTRGAQKLGYYNFYGDSNICESSVWILLEF